MSIDRSFSNDLRLLSNATEHYTNPDNNQRNFQQGVFTACDDLAILTVFYLCFFLFEYMI